MTRHLLLSAAILSGFAFSAAAQTTVHPGNVEIQGDLTVDAGTTGSLYVEGDSVIDGSLCLGNTCTQGMAFANDETLVFQYTQHSIVFNDTSSSTSPNRDWKLRINDPQTRASGGIDKFAVEDTTAGTTPFTIEGGAPENALWLGSAGDVGLGTALPQSDLHIVDGTTPAIRLEQDGSQGQTPQQWVLQGNHGGFELYNPTAGVSPVYVKTGTNGYSLVVDNAGQVGVGAFTPEAALHVLRSNGTAKLYVQENSVVVSPRTLLDLRNYGRPEIVMGNSATNGEWSFGAGTNFILKQGAVGTDSSVKTKLFEITPTGDASLTGSLTTGGTTCGGGCDLVFSDSYDLPSIAEHAAQMFALGHLPNVGPTPEGAPLNVSDKLGRMLNELEHAHIYIAELEEKLASSESRSASRIDELETLVRSLAARLDQLGDQ